MPILPNAVPAAAVHQLVCALRLAPHQQLQGTATGRLGKAVVSTGDTGVVCMLLSLRHIHINVEVAGAWHTIVSCRGRGQQTEQYMLWCVVTVVR
jgi:hypothetical protein